jgi:hypothetical protein
VASFLDIQVKQIEHGKFSHYGYYYTVVSSTWQGMMAGGKLERSLR